jgi:hypothetical protein
MPIQPEQLTVEHLRLHARIVAVAGDDAVEVRKNRRLAPMMAWHVEAPVMAPDLEIEVPSLEEAHIAPLVRRIEQLQAEINAAGRKA